uniref:glycerophosphodiester phosphodiesterase n=1 Tax=uncultured Sphingomonas sp. TaxID=158754 RepID=UPI0025DCFD77|nr:glycerophosphodiester phosphodiesterase [uncultured Sphingomonas sp.]
MVDSYTSGMFRLFLPLLASLSFVGAAVPSASRIDPIVIAHRGASAERPEHTLAAYDLAVSHGADFIEPDLVMTRDGVLVARHENEIGGTTDVASRLEFRDRRRTRVIDGQPVTGWFTEDFSLAELRTLRARERLPELRPQNTSYDGHFLVPTLAEVIELARRRSQETGRSIGIYPELKHPTYFRGVGLPMEETLVAELNRAGWRDRHAPVFVQSFEVGTLQRLNRLTKVRLVQLLDGDGRPFDRPDLTYRGMATAAGMTAIARYADGLGPAKELIIPRDPSGRTGKPTSLVRNAKAAGLLVHPWTFRPENIFLPAELRRGDDVRAHGNIAAEAKMFLELGVDGFFTDAPELGIAARDASRRP